MPGYDVMNGLAEVGPIGYLVGIALIALIGKWISWE